MAVDVTKTRRCNWNATWNTTDLGGVDDVSPNITMMVRPITIGTIGEAPLGDRFVGLEGTVEIVCREVTRVLMEKMFPWFAGTTGTSAVDLSPAVNVDLYTYAQKLTLHPTDLAADVTAQDLELLKTVPVQGFNLSRTGRDDDGWRLVFKIYPDRSQLPALVYGKLSAESP